MRNSVSLLGGFAAALCAVPAAQAALVSPQCGPTICYVWDDAQPAAQLDSLGTPTVVGDSVFFTPVDFKAVSENGSPAIATAIANFVFTKIYSHDGSEVEGTGGEIGMIKVDESGDYRIVGGDSVDVTLRLQALNLASAELTTVTETFAANADTGGLSPDWTLTGIIDPQAAFDGVANRINLGVQNTLTAQTDANGELAWIQKKFVLTVTTVVPVPAAVWLFGSALGLLGWIRRRTL
jgi:hypothetical protein